MPARTLAVAGLAALALGCGPGVAGPDAADAVAAPAAMPLSGQHDWYAWVDRMPPGPASLHVKGVVELPVGGLEAALTPTAPQGFNPAILMLDLVLAESDEATPTTLEARYDLRPYEGGYDAVSILYEGEVIHHIDTIEVTY